MQREQALNLARQALEEAEHTLKDTEQQRLASEQKLAPLRERAGDLRLKEQEARIAEENFSAQLEQAGAVEEELADKLERGMRPGALQTEINRLGEEIAALGAVNLAALDELTRRARAPLLSRAAVARPARSGDHAGKCDPAHRPGNPRAPAGHLRRGQHSTWASCSRPCSAAARRGWR